MADDAKFWSQLDQEHRDVIGLRLWIWCCHSTSSSMAKRREFINFCETNAVALRDPTLHMIPEQSVRAGKRKRDDEDEGRRQSVIDELRSLDLLSTRSCEAAAAPTPAATASESDVLEPELDEQVPHTVTQNGTNTDRAVDVSAPRQPAGPELGTETVNAPLSTSSAPQSQDPPEPTPPSATALPPAPTPPPATTPRPPNTPPRATTPAPPQTREELQPTPASSPLTQFSFNSPGRDTTAAGRSPNNRDQTREVRRSPRPRRLVYHRNDLDIYAKAFFKREEDAVHQAWYLVEPEGDDGLIPFPGNLQWRKGMTASLGTNGLTTEYQGAPDVADVVSLQYEIIFSFHAMAARGIDLVGSDFGNIAYLQNPDHQDRVYVKALHSLWTRRLSVAMDGIGGQGQVERVPLDLSEETLALPAPVITIQPGRQILGKAMKIATGRDGSVRSQSQSPYYLVMGDDGQTRWTREPNLTECQWLDYAFASVNFEGCRVHRNKVKDWSISVLETYARTAHEHVFTSFEAVQGERQRKQKQKRKRKRV